MAAGVAQKALSCNPRPVTTRPRLKDLERLELWPSLTPSPRPRSDKIKCKVLIEGISLEIKFRSCFLRRTWLKDLEGPWRDREPFSSHSSEETYRLFWVWGSCRSLHGSPPVPISASQVKDKQNISVLKIFVHVRLHSPASARLTRRWRPWWFSWPKLWSSSTLFWPEEITFRVGGALRLQHLNVNQTASVCHEGRGGWEAPPSGREKQRFQPEASWKIDSVWRYINVCFFPGYVIFNSHISNTAGLQLTVWEFHFPPDYRAGGWWSTTTTSSR